MIKFLEFNGKDLQEGQSFADGLNLFVSSNIKKTDSIISVKYKKYLLNGNPASSVFITIDTDSIKPENVNEEKQLYFFELNEQDFSEGIQEGRSFYNILNEDFTQIIGPEDDVLAIEYDKYFYQGNVFSGVLLLMNVKL